MKKFILLILAILPMIAGCGSDNNSTPQPTAASLKLSSQGTIPAGTAGMAVSGIGVTIELPTGVTVKKAADGTVDASVVVASGLFKSTNSSVVTPIFTDGSPAKLDFTIASTAVDGVQVGEYATITLILSGVTPIVTDFKVTKFDARDMDLVSIPALTSKPALTVN